VRAERPSLVAGLVLAAGGSSRLGRPKQLLPYRGATLLDAVLATARACAFGQLMVALGGAADEVRDAVDLAGADVVVNDAYGTGCSSSIAAATAAIDPRCEVLVLLLGDQPGVTAEAVSALLAGRGEAPLAVCRYDDGRGHPFAFSRAVFRGSRAPARRQGRVEAARPPCARRRRGPRVRARSARRRHVGRLRGGAGRRHRMSRRVRAGAPAALVAALPDVDALVAALGRAGYLADPGLATALFLSLRLPQPLLLEGEAGVGKTEAARALAEALGTPLIRLQCYEGMDASEALYEWNYPRQLLRIRLAEAGGRRTSRSGSLRQRVPRPAPRARSHRAPGAVAGRAARRRARPCRPPLRGVPARSARRRGGHRAGARHDPGDRAAGRSC
jgi:molybdenum cofactor cytidylyltransferase